MKILVTGGTGYIGSHTVVALVEGGHEVVIVDNLSNSSLAVLRSIEEITGSTPTFYKADVADVHELRKIFDQEKDIKGVIHFAAHKSISESLENPLKYYNNNLVSTCSLLSVMSEQYVQNIVFSSSATVYGSDAPSPITEDTPASQATNPYGQTKIICEDILHDSIKKSRILSGISLRYFNPVGAHPSGKIGEIPVGPPSNLVPYITQSLVGRRPALTIFGDDYDTADGTCIRDFIHVEDLAQAHIKAFEHLAEEEPSYYNIYNVGTGTGTSVLELLSTFQDILGKPVPYTIGQRRKGDTAVAWADITKIQKDLNWKSTRSLSDALSDAWNWQKKI